LRALAHSLAQIALPCSSGSMRVQGERMIVAFSGFKFTSLADS
jgi:hypothetical protein